MEAEKTADMNRRKEENVKRNKLDPSRNGGERHEAEQASAPDLSTPGPNQEAVTLTVRLGADGPSDLARLVRQCLPNATEDVDTIVQFELSPLAGQNEHADEAPRSVAVARQIRFFHSTYPSLEAANAARWRLPDDVSSWVTVTTELNKAELLMLVRHHAKKVQFFHYLLHHNGAVREEDLRSVNYHSDRLKDFEGLLGALRVRRIYDATARTFDPQSELAEFEENGGRQDVSALSG